jgi:hypothetical protein
VSEPKQRQLGALGNDQIAKCIQDRAQAVPIGRYRQHAERLPSELLLMLLGRIGTKISTQLSLEAPLRNVRAGYWHRAPVHLDREAPAGAIGKPNPNNSVFGAEGVEGAHFDALL